MLIQLSRLLHSVQMDCVSVGAAFVVSCIGWSEWMWIYLCVCVVQHKIDKNLFCNCDHVLVWTCEWAMPSIFFTHLFWCVFEFSDKCDLWYVWVYVIKRFDGNWNEANESSFVSKQTKPETKLNCVACSHRQCRVTKIMTKKYPCPHSGRIENIIGAHEKMAAFEWTILVNPIALVVICALFFRLVFFPFKTWIATRISIR